MVITANFIRKDGSEEDGGSFAVTALPFIDIVFELKCCKHLNPGDQLIIRFDVPVSSYEGVNWSQMVKTNEYTEDWEYSTGILEDIFRVTHFRFTKRGDDAWIDLFDGMPEMLYAPITKRAEKIR